MNDLPELELNEAQKLIVDAARSVMPDFKPTYSQLAKMDSRAQPAEDIAKAIPDQYRNFVQVLCKELKVTPRAVSDEIVANNLTYDRVVYRSSSVQGKLIREEHFEVAFRDALSRTKGDEIVELYEEVLGRLPDVEGYRYWSDFRDKEGMDAVRKFFNT